MSDTQITYWHMVWINSNLTLNELLQQFLAQIQNQSLLCTYELVFYMLSSKWFILMFLLQIGVKVLSLPAAHATVETWTRGFGFRPMSADALLETRDSLRLLVFPGTEVLYKPLLPEGDPYIAPKKPKHISAVEGTPPDQRRLNNGTDASKEIKPAPWPIANSAPGNIITGPGNIYTAPGNGNRPILQFTPQPIGTYSSAAAIQLQKRSSPSHQAQFQHAATISGAPVSSKMYKPAHALPLNSLPPPVMTTFRPNKSPNASSSPSPRMASE